MNLHQFLTTQHWCVADPTGVLIPLATKKNKTNSTSVSAGISASTTTNNPGIDRSMPAPNQPSSESPAINASGNANEQERREHNRIIHPLPNQPVFGDVASQAAHEMKKQSQNQHPHGMDLQISSQQSNAQTRHARHIVFTGTCCFTSRNRACRFQESGGDGSTLENVGFCVTTKGCLRIRFTTNLVVGVLTKHIKQVTASPHSSHKYQPNGCENKDEVNEQQQQQQQQHNKDQHQNEHSPESSTSDAGPPVTTIFFSNGALQLWAAREEDSPSFLKFLGALQHQMKWPKSTGEKVISNCQSRAVLDSISIVNPSQISFHITSTRSRSTSHELGSESSATDTTLTSSSTKRRRLESLDGAESEDECSPMSQALVRHMQKLLELPSRAERALGLDQPELVAQEFMSTALPAAQQTELVQFVMEMNRGSKGVGNNGCQAQEPCTDDDDDDDIRCVNAPKVMELRELKQFVDGQRRAVRERLMAQVLLAARGR